ncbi:MAG: hypothetical protein KY476_04280 [Planctomycetes bacterium]|nr:hypothetical protein [Planctomycetota bacterium]
MNLTEQQQRAVERGQPVRVTIGRARCILIREDVYERKGGDCDDWTLEEMNLLADEAHAIISQTETDED